MLELESVLLSWPARSILRNPDAQLIAELFGELLFEANRSLVVNLAISTYEAQCFP